MRDTTQEIGGEAINAAWLEVSKIPAPRIPMEMERAARAQPDLLAFILGSTEGMSAGVSELAGFIYVVIWRVFRAETQRGAPPVTSAAIQKKLEENEGRLGELDGVDPQSLDLTALRRLSAQPMMLRHVIDSIAEAEEDEAEPLQWSPEEKGSVILLLKTAIDVLDESRERARETR